MLNLQHLSKAYLNNGKKIEAIGDVSADIHEREFVAFLGPSGCGKTTLLRCIAGTDPLSGGKVLLNGKENKNTHGEIGMVFQDFSLFPWLTVEQNIEFGLKVKKMPHKEREKVVKHFLQMTGLSDFRQAYPNSLSGGMKQRVAIARTLANDPVIILMDEPFASLDSLTRASMQEFLTGLWEESHKTVIFVTHDVEEAIFLADTIHILSRSPTTIKETFKVPFKRPRQHALKHGKEFFDFKNEVLNSLERQ